MCCRRILKKRSFEIITEELGEVSLIPGTEPIVKRCIHTSADFEYAKSLKFSEDAVQRAMDAIRDGAWIVTDTQMGKSGINKKKLAQYGGEVCCFMSDEETANMAKEQGTTRAVASMERAAKLDKKLIFAIGNAPTALIRLYEMIQEGRLKPELIIGVPVGVCQCGTVKRTDPVTERHTVYRGKRTKRRKQYRSMYLQCVVVYDG